MRLLETGVIGLTVFLTVGLSVVLAARKTIARRDRESAPIALVGAACAVCFLVMSTLFDLLSFPHATYVYLFLAGLVAAVLGEEGRPRAPAQGTTNLPTTIRLPAGTRLQPALSGAPTRDPS
jgi:O-antigen ligase